MDRLKRTKARAIIQQALRLGNARVGTVGHVIPCLFGELFRDGLAPFVPRQEFQVCGPTEPTSNPFCVSSQGKRGRRNSVKCFANAHTSTCNRQEERLRDVIGVNVMQRFHPDIR
jgi:hypothetical protein